MMQTLMLMPTQDSQDYREDFQQGYVRVVYVYPDQYVLKNTVRIPHSSVQDTLHMLEDDVVY
jgi:hypothetical protein